MILTKHSIFFDILNISTYKSVQKSYEKTTDWQTAQQEVYKGWHKHKVPNFYFFLSEEIYFKFQ
jgi:hypothetical protein